MLGDAEAIGALKRAEGKDLDGRVRRRAREVARELAEGSAQDEQVRVAARLGREVARREP